MRPVRGLIYSAIAGCIMGLFYPQLMRSISPNFNSAPIAAGMLTPYTALMAFAVGVLGSNIVWNTAFMMAGKVGYRDYFRGSARLHAIGVLGGAIWMLALSFNVIASGVAGPAISYALGQGATLVAALWGLLIWKEFRLAPAGTGRYLGLMLAGYAAGLILMAPPNKMSTVQIDKVDFSGWPNCYRVSNGEVDLIVTSDVGPGSCATASPAGRIS